MIKNLQDLRAEAREDFLATFKCIDSSCDQNGCVPHQISDNEWEAQQCQYCWEIRFPAADKLNTFIDSVLDLVEKECVPEKKAMEIFHSANDGSFYDNTWNACRKLVLTNLSTLRS